MLNESADTETERHQNASMSAANRVPVDTNIVLGTIAIDIRQASKFGIEAVLDGELAHLRVTMLEEIAQRSA